MFVVYLVRSLRDSSKCQGAEMASAFLLNFSSCLQDGCHRAGYCILPKPHPQTGSRTSQGKDSEVSWCASFLLSERKENNVSQALHADSLLGPAGQNRVTGHRLSWEMDKVGRVVDSG